MKKQYMDFVPTKSTGTVGPRTGKNRIEKSRLRPETQKSLYSAKKSHEIRSTQSKKTAKLGFSTEKEPRLGMIEDMGAKFVKTSVPKRPLNQNHFRENKSEVATIKAMKVANERKTQKTGEQKKPVRKTLEKNTYHTPKPAFINQDKVEKRPLSKNVYHKKEVTPEEELKGPVTIVSKPEKQAHAGLIVTIILTIILGAAAGTIAFLLLPK